MLDLALMLLPFVALGLMLGVGCCAGFQLTNCDDPDDVVYTRTDVSEYVGRVVTLDGDATCRTVERLCGLPGGESFEAVTVDQDYDDCEGCGVEPCTRWRLTHCLDPEDVICTETDMSAYVDSVVQVNGKCYGVICEEEECDGEPEAVTVEDSFADCEECLGDAVCDACDGNGPDEIDVTIPNGFSSSGAWDTAIDTFRLTANLSNGDTCQYDYNFPGGSYWTLLTILITSTAVFGVNRINIRLQGPSPEFRVLVWRIESASSFDCDFVNFAVTYLNASPGFPFTWDGSPVTLDRV